MKKLILIILFLIPMAISSILLNTAYFNKQENKTIIVHLTDKNLYLDLNDYIIGVVAGEMPALFNEEALKAQAIASRSYAANRTQNKMITISSTTNDQVYLPNYELKNKWQDKYKEYYTKIEDCVKATDNLVVKRNNKIMKTFYFSMSNGYTEDSITVFNEPSFKSVESPYETSLSNFLVTKKISISEFKNMLNILNSDVSIKDLKRSKTDRVDILTINNIQYSGIEFRKLLNLRSTDFTIEIIDDSVKITTKGYGHGVGMSQYGANEMAKKGASYIDIIKHYYNDIIIQNI